VISSEHTSRRYATVENNPTVTTYSDAFDNRETLEYDLRGES
jgi:hypothetical protein